MADLGYLPLSPEDVQQLANVAHGVKLNMESFFTELGLLGIYLVLFVIALHTLRTRSARTARSWLLLSVLILTGAVTVVQCAIHIIIVSTQLQEVFIDNLELPVASRVQKLRDLPWLIGIRYTSLVFLGSRDTGFVFLVSDFLAGWRAISVWRSHSRPFGIVPCLLYSTLLSSCGLWVAYCVLARSELFERTSSDEELAARVMITGSGMSILSNLIATGAIGYTAYGHVAHQKRNRLRNLGAVKILFFLTESGLFYAILQIIRLALTCSYTSSSPPYGPLATPSFIFPDGAFILTAMYTPALIIIIHHGYSIADTIQLNPSEDWGSSSSAAKGRGSGRHEVGSATISGIEFERGFEPWESTRSHAIPAVSTRGSRHGRESGREVGDISVASGNEVDLELGTQDSGEEFYRS